ncbi:MAG: cytochrome c oxidase subunit II [Rhodospirillales bacterium]|nr:cytochrome c oxidase subunit II [Rhodospirillales bacterium]
MHIGKLAGAVLALACVATGAMAAEVVGAPVDWGLNFQVAGSEMMSELRRFHDWLLWLILAISLFVLALLVWVMVRYNASANPTPGTRTHNTVLEILWTAIPAIILVIVAVPSFRILYAADVIPPADMTIKATGYQWYWGYEYPDHGDFYFDAFIVDSADEFEEPRPFARLLSTDLPVVVPVDTTVRVLVTAADVLHSWTIPALGVKVDGVPGRLNETWFRAEREGIYYGQCSELCGDFHGRMPIEVHVVSQEAFDAWVAEAQAEFAHDSPLGEPVLLTQTAH